MFIDDTVICGMRKTIGNGGRIEFHRGTNKPSEVLEEIAKDAALVDLLYSLIRQPAQAEKTDEHSRIQKAVTALGMNYSLGRSPDNEPETFLMPTVEKLLKMISTGLGLLGTEKGDVELVTIQKSPRLSKLFVRFGTHARGQ